MQIFQNFCDGVAVLALEVIDLVQPVLNLLQLLRLVVHLVQIAADVSAAIGQLVAHLLHAQRQRLQLRQKMRQLAEVAGQLLHQLQNACGFLLALQQLFGGTEQADDPLGVGNLVTL